MWRTGLPDDSAATSSKTTLNTTSLTSLCNSSSSGEDKNRGNSKLGQRCCEPEVKVKAQSACLVPRVFPPTRKEVCMLCLRLHKANNVIADEWLVTYLSLWNSAKASSKAAKQKKRRGLLLYCYTINSSWVGYTESWNWNDENLKVTSLKQWSRIWLLYNYSLQSLWLWSKLQIHGWPHLDQTAQQSSSGHLSRRWTRWRICPCLSLWAARSAATAALPPRRSLYGQRRRWLNPCQRGEKDMEHEEDYSWAKHCNILLLCSRGTKLPKIQDLTNLLSKLCNFFKKEISLVAVAGGAETYSF